MTALDDRPATDAAPSVRPSLARAEVRRLTSRRFVRVLLLLALAGYALVIGISSTQFSQTTPEALAEAERRIVEQVEDSERFRQLCLQDPNRPADVSPDQFCGPPATAEGFRAEDFLDEQPFELAQALPDGSIAVAAATAVLAFLLGATYVGAEWSSRSMVALLFWEPRRGRVVLTKLAVLAVGAAALGLVGQLLWWGTAEVMARALGTTGPLPDGFRGDLLGQQARAVVLVVLTSLLGFSVSNLVRNTGAALGVGFVYFAVVENAVRAVKPRWQEWLLTDNAGALVSPGGVTVFLPGDGRTDEQGMFVDSGTELLLSNLHGALVLGGATAVLVGLGVLLFVRRDLH